MFNRVAGIIHNVADGIGSESAHALKVGAEVMRDAIAFDKAGSVLVAVVVVAFMFVIPRT